jgi:soluble lytic murein transglycosylase
MGKQHLALLLIFWASLGLGDVPLTAKEFAVLQEKFNKETNPSVKADEALKLGIEAYSLHDFANTVGYLNQALSFNTKLDDYAQYHLGLVARDNKDWAEAKKRFQSVVMHFPVSILKADAQIELVHIAMSEEKWLEAARVLQQIIENKSTKYFSRRKRRWVRLDGSDKLPSEIAYAQFETSLALKNRPGACALAKKLYVKHASYTILKGWGFGLPPIKTDKGQFPCYVSVEDHKKRFTNLLKSGEYDEILKELGQWEEQIKNKNASGEIAQIEIFRGRVDLALGNIDASVKHLHAAQDIQGRSYNLHLLLAKAYSETENYNAAIEAYLSAYASAGKTKDKTYALFMAAFSSYQNRDYDGASRRFEELIKHWPTSKYAADAKWHLAWIRYLKTDYEGALKDFDLLARGRWRKDPEMVQKLKYWQAMSELRLGNIEASRTHFSDLTASKNGFNYYTTAALARLKSLPAPLPNPMTGPAFIAPPDRPAEPALIAPPGSQPSPSPKKESRKVARAENEAAGTTGDGSGEAEVDKGAADTAEAVDDTADDEKDDKDDKDEKEKEVAEAPADLTEAGVPITTFKDPALAKRFDRVRELIGLGFSEWARREMQLIQSSTRNSEFREMLMVEYKNAGDYYRAKQISDDYFKTKRREKGMEAGRKYWEAAFPQAYEKIVSKWCDAYDVNPSFAWGIMRGESEYRQEVKSQAGAQGLMQMMLNTARKVSKLIPFEQEFKDQYLPMPEVNIRFGIWYIKRIEKTLDTTLKLGKATMVKYPLMAASYNAGPHRALAWLKDFGGLDMDEFIEHIPFKETRHYVKKVLTNYLIYQMLYKKETNPLSWITTPTVKFDGPKPSAESWN